MEICTGCDNKVCEATCFEGFVVDRVQTSSSVFVVFQLSTIKSSSWIYVKVAVQDHVTERLRVILWYEAGDNVHKYLSYV